MDSGFWDDLMGFLRTRLVDPGKIDEHDLDRFTVTNSPEEAVEVMLKAATDRFGLMPSASRPRRRRWWLFE